MSETVHYRGRLVPINMGDKTVEEVARKLVGGGRVKPHFDDYAEQLIYDHDNYTVLNGAIYEIVEKEWVDVYEDIFRSTKNGNGTIDFEIKYYNGGCGFEEALEEAIKDDA